MTRSAHFVGPQEGELFDVVGDRYRFLATKESTAGKYAIVEAIVPPGGGPPPHSHSREEEGFYVIDGEVAIYADGNRQVATPGCFVNMPVGGQHWFRNEFDKPAKLLILVAPGGMEGMFRMAGTPVADASAPFAPVDEGAKKRILASSVEYGVTISPPKH